MYIVNLVQTHLMCEHGAQLFSTVCKVVTVVRTCFSVNHAAVKSLHHIFEESSYLSHFDLVNILMVKKECTSYQNVLLAAGHTYSFRYLIDLCAYRQFLHFFSQM